MTNPFAELAPTAHLRIIPIMGGLPAEKATPLLAVLGEMLAQWRENGAITTSAFAMLEQGCFVAVAYEPAAGDVSGCTKDQLTHTLLQFEQQLGVPMLNAPNLAVEIEGRVRLLDREEFRRLRAEGVIEDTTTAFDHLIDCVGNFDRFRTTVAESWYNRIGRPKAPQA